jgi:hypothetical protein
MVLEIRRCLLFVKWEAAVPNALDLAIKCNNDHSRPRHALVWILKSCIDETWSFVCTCEYESTNIVYEWFTRCEVTSSSIIFFWWWNKQSLHMYILHTNKSFLCSEELCFVSSFLIEATIITLRLSVPTVVAYYVSIRRFFPYFMVWIM